MLCLVFMALSLLFAFIASCLAFSIMVQKTLSEEGIDRWSDFIESIFGSVE